MGVKIHYNNKVILEIDAAKIDKRIVTTKLFQQK